jgi:hypothetical protein
VSARAGEGTCLKRHRSRPCAHKRARTASDRLRDPRTDRRLREGAGADRPALRELEREWDIERWLETNASALAFVGVALGWRDRRWLSLPAVVTAFLVQHALQGWCPPLAVFRRARVRTRREIDAEKYALKALRGDFSAIATAENGRHAEAATTAVAR